MTYISSSFSSRAADCASAFIYIIKPSHCAENFNRNRRGRYVEAEALHRSTPLLVFGGLLLSYLHASTKPETPPCLTATLRRPTTHPIFRHKECGSLKYIVYNKCRAEKCHFSDNGCEAEIIFPKIKMPNESRSDAKRPTARPDELIKELAKHVFSVCETIESLYLPSERGRCLSDNIKCNFIGLLEKGVCIFVSFFF